MPISITAAQRDALYDLIHDRLSGIDDLWRAVLAGDHEAAQRLAWEYSDALRFVAEDLGWREEPAGPIELRTPPDVLRRVLSRLWNYAVSLDAFEKPQWEEVRESEERNRLVIEACSGVLAGLDR